ncbi:hypothetical protein G7085_10165 [Tessaracoccus sp. HDW20]|uniref:hypothetical protein n=1 Tax=Tessaracoccus coleopterorum TaxID=2714950 RepID=UPI0018D3979B|nr:hypothetical protein [Tessaracoccus coleopterorum]NHB84841.1 hypothetical protein [Tessaracoccus coleopterorum]
MSQPVSGGLVPGYELGAAIGRGGFATVYRARQISLDRDVAVKIDSRVLDDPRNRRRFLRESTASASSRPTRMWCRSSTRAPRGTTGPTSPWSSVRTARWGSS